MHAKKALLFIFAVFSLTSQVIGAGLKNYELDFHGEKIECGLWYPSKAKPQKHRILIYEVTAAKNAEISENINGVVVLSHGFGGSMYGLHYLAEFLADNGYAVLTVSYPDLKGLKSKNPALFPPLMRADLSYTAFSRLRESGWISKSAFGQVFSAGFSMGGYTALSNIGAKAKTTNLNEYCSLPDNFPLLCGNREKLTKNNLAIMSRPLPDIKAALLLAPALGALYDKNSFSGKLPVKVFIAEDDSMIYGKFDAGYIASVVPNAKAFVIKGADHSVFAAPCSDRAKRLMPERCDDEGIDKKSVQKMINEETLKLFNSMK